MTGPARGQTTTTLEGTGAKLAGYYPAPHQTQMQWLLEGAKTQPQPDGTQLITDAKLQSFTLEGGREMAVRAPRCWYSSKAKTLSSPGALHASFTDGEFTLDGEGFLLFQTNLDLTVSNRVHTHISGALLGNTLPAGRTPAASAERTPGAAASDIEVFSDRFNYSTNTGRGIYRENVRATGTNLAMTSRMLEVVVPSQQQKTAHLESISADGDVKVESSGIQAAGEHALYTVETDQVLVTGQPTWRATDKNGSADELIVERTNGVLHANGNAMLTTPASRTGGYGFLSRPGQELPPATNSVPKMVQIRSENYLLRTNFALFHDRVRAEERAGDRAEGTMTCGQLTMAGAGSNTTATAEQEVDIRQTDPATGETNRFTAGKAVYDGGTGAIEFTLNPRWESGQRQGTGEVMTVSGDPEALVVKGHAFMRLPADELAAPTGVGGSAPAPAKAATLTNSFANIHSESY